MLSAAGHMYTFRFLYSICFLILISHSTNKTIAFLSHGSLQAVILAAGKSSRFKTGISKLITPLCGQPIIVYAAQLMHQLAIPTTVVVGYQKKLVKKAIQAAQMPAVNFAVQREQLGTGHALFASKENWFADNILVMMGDMPLISSDVVNQLIDEHYKHNAVMTISTCYKDSLNGFGRIIKNGNHLKVVEEKNFTYDPKEYPYVNAGLYIINRKFLEEFSSFVEKNDLTGEFYITSLVEIASDHNLCVRAVEFPYDPFFNGINTFQELASVERIKQNEIINYWMTHGVRFIAPLTACIDINVIIGKGTVIGSGVQLCNNTFVGEFCTINPHVVLDNAIVEDNVTIGANRVLVNTHIKEGNFVAPLC